MSANPKPFKDFKWMGFKSHMMATMAKWREAGHLTDTVFQCVRFSRLKLTFCNFLFSVFSTFLPPKEVRERSKKFPWTARIHFGQVSSQSEARRPKKSKTKFSKHQFNDYSSNDYFNVSVAEVPKCYSRATVIRTYQV